jgi:hypothetical protein
VLEENCVNLILYSSFDLKEDVPADERTDTAHDVEKKNIADETHETGVKKRHPARVL